MKYIRYLIMFAVSIYPMIIGIKSVLVGLNRKHHPMFESDKDKRRIFIKGIGLLILSVIMIIFYTIVIILE